MRKPFLLIVFFCAISYQTTAQMKIEDFYKDRAPFLIHSVVEEVDSPSVSFGTKRRMKHDTMG